MRAALRCETARSLVLPPRVHDFAKQLDVALGDAAPAIGLDGRPGLLGEPFAGRSVVQQSVQHCGQFGHIARHLINAERLALMRPGSAVT